MSIYTSSNTTGRFYNILSTDKVEINNELDNARYIKIGDLVKFDYDGIEVIINKVSSIKYYNYILSNSSPCFFTTPLETNKGSELDFLDFIRMPSGYYPVKYILTIC